MLAPLGTESVGTEEYTLEGVRSDNELKAGNKLVPIEVITVQSGKFGIVFSFNVTETVFQSNGAQVLASEKTAQVNQIAAHDHVSGVRWEEDQASDGNLYNYLVVTVGTLDGLIGTDVRIRMDHIGDPSAFGAIEQAWTLLTHLGA